MEERADEGRTPKALESKPKVTESMGEYVEAFGVLSSRRSGGFGPNPISMTDILAYLQIFGASDIEEFVELIVLMDKTYFVKSSELDKRKKGS